MRFTVLIPTFDNGSIVGRAIQSVLRQSEQDLEIFVVGDGAPEETLTAVKRMADRDRRVRLFAYDKGARHGEALRHDALHHATGDVVCYLSDDDFWFKDHLRIMGGLLASADFAHTRFARVRPPWRIRALAGDLGDAVLRTRILETQTSIFGLSVAGHRLSAYRRLPEGWAPAPPGVWTDLHMWRKWLSAPGMRLVSSPIISALNFRKATWRDVPGQQQRAEQRLWYELFKDESMTAALQQIIPTDETDVPVATVIAEARRRRRSRRRTGFLRRLVSR